MIKSSELRIGNKVKDRGGKILTIDYWEAPGKVAQNVVLEGMTMHPLTEMCLYLEPIPLTTEILEKCGFIQDGNGNYWKDLITHYLEIGIYGDECYYPIYAMLPEMSIEDEQRVHLNLIRYVHQLQNLFFILQGEELTINL